MAHRQEDYSQEEFMHLHHSLASGFRRFASVSRTPVVAIMLATATAPALMGKGVVRLTPAELYVLDELKAGRETDLIKLAPEKRDLRNEFVEKVITGGYPDPEVQRRGIRIHNAV